MNARNGNAILRLEGVSKRFGGLQVLDGVSFDVMPGSIHGVIGPNGAGKTTLFNVINGILRADSGRIVFKGVEINRMPLSRIARLSMGRTFQVARVFREMTLMDNMLVAGIPLGLSAAEARDRAQRLLAFARLDRLSDQVAIEISGGQQKLLEFVRAMMGDPALVLLDEPFNGISPALIELLIEMVVRLNREEGTTFLLISHEMPHVSYLCSTVTVLSGGRLLAQGSPAEIRDNPAVVEAYLGS